MKNYINKYIINTLDNGEKILFYSYSKKEYDSIIKEAKELSTMTDVNRFIDKFGTDPRNIVTHGDVKLWTESLKLSKKGIKESTEYRDNIESVLNSFMPKTIAGISLEDNTIGDRYKCWCGTNLDIKDLDIVLNHKTAYDSWKCLITKIGNPDYCIIVKEY